MESEGEVENPPASDPLVTPVVDTLQKHLVNEHTEPPPVSPIVTMPSISEPVPSPTTGPVPKSVLNHPVEIPPSPAPLEERLSYYGDEDFELYDDLPASDPSKYSHISFEDLGVNGQAEGFAPHVSNSTIASMIYWLLFCISSCFKLTLSSFPGGLGRD